MTSGKKGKDGHIFSFGKEAGGNTPGQMQHSCDLAVLRSDARLAEVEIRNLTTEDQLRVMLVNAASGTETDRETTGKQHRDIRLPSSQKESEAFLVTREAIDTYLKESRDGNLIHRGEAAVVPGFLMVNRILEGYGELGRTKEEQNDEYGNKNSSKERNDLEYIRNYNHGTDDDHADRFYLHKDPAPIFLCQHYGADAGG